MPADEQTGQNAVDDLIMAHNDTTNLFAQLLVALAEFVGFFPQ